MQSLKYFEQEGNTYHVKIQKGMFYFLSLLSFAGMAATLIYGSSKGAYFFAVSLGILGTIGILRATAKMSFNTSARSMTVKTFFFTPEKEYSFDEFDHFLISKMTNIGITLNVSATMIFNKNGKTKRILVRQGFFVTKPLQNFTDELSDIMGLPQ
ncbi:MAG: hypothetical protein JWR38_3160 [Mucilaginibacter sp.]|nr:hypothetical protein [Mucilaginibacter sp.]